MRDFRDAKAMAHTLRAALATKGHKVTNSESLELIAQAFGVADWNTLAATIHEEAAVPRKNATNPPHPSTTESGPAFFRPPRRRKRARVFHRAFVDAAPGPRLRQPAKA